VAEPEEEKAVGRGSGVTEPEEEKAVGRGSGVAEPEEEKAVGRGVTEPEEEKQSGAGAEWRNRKKKKQSGRGSGVAEPEEEKAVGRGSEVTEPEEEKAVRARERTDGTGIGEKTMINETISIKVEGSLPDTRLITYIQDHFDEVDIDTRPLVLVCPGGAYAYTSNREGEALAMQFLAMGYHAAVLKYSCAPAVYPTALTELASSILLIRRNAEKWHVNPEQVIVLGCSAGGHLAASMGVFWDEDFLARSLGLKETEHNLLRPDGMILCYPVITSGEFAHRGSIKNLLGEREAELSEKMSLELQVNSKTPPAFIWHTFTDGSVPVENSLLFVSALRRAGVPTEFHMYPCGGHGLSLANRLTASRGGGAVQEECTSWISLAHTWMEQRYGCCPRQER